MKLHEVVQTSIDPNQFASNKEEIRLHLQQLGIGKYVLHDDDSVELNNLRINSTITPGINLGKYQRITKIPFKLHKVHASLEFIGMPNFESFAGFPKSVTNLDIHAASVLKSFKHFPTDVGMIKIASCQNVNNIQELSKTTLKHSIALSDLSSLRTFGGFPKLANNKVSISLRHLDNLSSLDGLPKTCGDLRLEWLPIENLIGCPQTVNGKFVAYELAIKSLEGGPKIVHGDYAIENCKHLSSLEGLPHEITGILEFTGLTKAINVLELFDVRGNFEILISNYLHVANIVNKWLPTRDIAKAGKELDAAGYSDWTG